MRTFSPTLAPPAPATPEPAADTGQTCLRDVLAEDAPRAVFQPLVELTSRGRRLRGARRGPAGTELERPDALFARARADGLLGELDWACRAAAVRGALDAGLPAGVRLFVNMEPEALGVPCPDRLRELWAAARELDVVVESRSGR